jgi:hypothetical protein
MKMALSLATLLLSSSLYAGSYSITCSGVSAEGKQLTFTRDQFSLVTPSESTRYPSELQNLVTVDESFINEGGEFKFARSYEDQTVVATVKLDKKLATLDNWEEGGEDCDGGLGHGPGEYGSTEKFLATLEMDYEAPVQLELTCVEHGGYSGNCYFDEE